MGKLKLVVSYNSSYNKIHSHINFFAYMYMFPSVSENIQITCSMTVISYNVNIKQSICLTVFACLWWPFHSVSVAEKEKIILLTFTYMYASFNNDDCISMSASLTINY